MMACHGIPTGRTVETGWDWNFVAKVEGWLTACARRVLVSVKDSV